MTLKQGTISVMSQGVSSAGNFLAVMIPAKVLAPDDFGHYIVALTTILLLAGFSRALIGMPIRIQGVDVTGSNKEQYYSSLTFLGLVTAILSGIVSIPIMMLTTTGSTSLLLATVVATGAFQIHDLSRAVRASKLQWTRILLGDIILHVSRVLALGVLAVLGCLDTTMALLIYICASIASPVFTRFRIRIVCKIESLREVISKTWLFGRWLLMETVVSSLSTQMYVLLTSGVLGPASAGVLGALQQLINVINVVQIGIHDYLLPHVRSALNHGDYDRWKRWTIDGGAAMVTATAVIVSPIVIYEDKIIRLVYSEAISGHRQVVLILAIVAVIGAINCAYTIAYRTSGMPQAGLMAKVISALVTISVGVLLVRNHGLVGAAIGVLLTQIIWLLTFLYLTQICHSLSRENIKYFKNRIA